MQRHEVPIEGDRLVVWTDGPVDGPPVLLLHGFPDDHTVWSAQIPALVEAGYRVVAPDQRGCGGTGPVGGLDAYTLPARCCTCPRPATGCNARRPRW